MRDESVRRWSHIHALIYRVTGGLIGKRLVNNDMLLVTTIGRLTGEPHTVPLLYLRDEEKLVVVASYGGRDRHPDWYLNLMENPRVHVEVPGSKEQMTARTAEPLEREAWWPRVVDAYDGYAGYQSRTEREIPLVFLEPAI